MRFQVRFVFIMRWSAEHSSALFGLRDIPHVITFYRYDDIVRARTQMPAHLDAILTDVPMLFFFFSFACQSQFYSVALTLRLALLVLQLPSTIP